MPQEGGLPEGAESRPLTGGLSLPPKKREMTARKALPAPGSPRPSGSTLAPGAWVLPGGPGAACPPPQHPPPWVRPVAPAGTQQPWARCALPGHVGDLFCTTVTADGAAGGCRQPPGIATTCGRGWGTPRGGPGARMCTPGWMSPSRQHRDGQDTGMGAVGALPGLWSAASPGGASTGGTELGGGLPPAAPLPAGSVPPQARLYYGLAVGLGEPGRAAASLHNASTPPATLPTPSPSEPPSPSPPPPTSAAPPQPPPGAAFPQGTAEEQPPADTGTVPTAPTPGPAHLSTSPLLTPTAPCHALLYSQPLCPAVAYRQCRAPSGTGGLWSVLLPTASTAFVLPHFQRGSPVVLPGGEQKKVEELREEDFLRCAAAGTELRISSCVVRGIRRSPHAGFASLRVCLGEQDGQLSVEVLQEFPFFARRRGWVSCCPHRTCQLYQLPCQQLAVGDICMVWSPRRQGHDTHGAQREPPGDR